MKRYLIKEVSKATESNKNFAGETHIHYSGKGGYVYEEADVEAFPYYYYKEYGYSRKRDAEKNYAYQNPENNEYWQSTVSIVEFVINTETDEIL